VFHSGFLDPRFRGAQQYQRGLLSGGYVQSERYLQTRGYPQSEGYVQSDRYLQSGAYVQSERYLQTEGTPGDGEQDSLDYMLDEFGRMIDLYGNVISP
jgi:hypothetical protein